MLVGREYFAAIYSDIGSEIDGEDMQRRFAVLTIQITHIEIMTCTISCFGHLLVMLHDVLYSYPIQNTVVQGGAASDQTSRLAMTWHVRSAHIDVERCTRAEKLN